MMNPKVVYEYDVLIAQVEPAREIAGLHQVPPSVFAWLEAQALRISDVQEAAWLRLTQRKGLRAVQLNSFVGVIRAPDGTQIEVLPKIGKATSETTAREQLLEMLCCLGPFRHVQTQSATLLARQMPLLEVFISEFLRAVEHIVKRGMRSDYHALEDNLFALRGKLQMATHLQKNLCRRDRFYTRYDEFSPDRPENRLLHAALRCVLRWTASPRNQQRARELCFAFADIPASVAPAEDFLRVRLDRGMAHYEPGLAWARLILNEHSPLTGNGENSAPSLLFPMEAVYEAFVARYLPRQLNPGYKLKTQTRALSLVRHLENNWFRLKPDMLVHLSGNTELVLDTKWKLIDSRKNNGSEKYGLSQNDFYQLHAYGQSYLDGKGHIALVYPRTDDFNEPLPVFDFPKSSDLKLWVLPFCLKKKQLILPESESWRPVFNSY